MASASPVAIQAIPDRAPAGRSESKSADAGGGHFAGLVAQFTRPQDAPKLPAAAPLASARSLRAAARKTLTQTGTPSASREASHPAATAGTPAGPAASPIHPEPKQAASEAQATSAATTAPSPAAPPTDPEAPSPGATTVPPAQQPLAATPPTQEDTAPVQLVLTAAPGQTPPAATPVTPGPSLPGPLSTASQTSAAQPAAAAPETSAQPADLAPVQAVLAGPGVSPQGIRGSENLAPGPVITAAATPEGEPTADKPSLPAALPQALAQLLAKATSQPAAGPVGTTHPAPPTATLLPALDTAPPSAQPPTSLDAAAAPKTSAQPANRVLVQAAPAGADASPNVARGGEDLAPGPVSKAAATPLAAPITSAPSVPAELPQAWAQLLVKGPSQTVVAGPEATTRQVPPTATLPPAVAHSTQAPVPSGIASALPTPVQPADPAFVPAVLAGPGADLKGLPGNAELTPGPMAKAATATVAEPMVDKPNLTTALPQELAHDLDKAASQPVITQPEGTTPQAPPSTAPPPALDATAPPLQALPAADGDRAPKASTLSAAPALLQAVLAEPVTGLKGFRRSEEPAPGPVVKATTGPVAEPATGKPSVPAAPPQELAQVLAKATSQSAAGPESTTGQAPLKGSGTPAPMDPGEPKLTDLQSLAGRTLDGASPALLGSLQRTAEGPAATAPAAAPAPSQAPATPPSAPVLQVEGGLRWMLKSGAQEAQLQLHPDSLGQVTIHLKVEGGEVHAKVWVSEAASVQTVKEGRPHLEQSLRDQGLHLGSFDLQQGHRPFQEAPSAPSSRERTLPEASVARQEPPAPTPAPILNAHHVELYA